MRYVLKLEQIGTQKPWVAEIVGRCNKFGVSREFITGIRDYSESNSKGTRGIYTYYSLKPGVYEVFDPRSWKGSDRFFAEVNENQELLRITFEDVTKRLDEEQKAFIRKITEVKPEELEGEGWH